MNTGRPVRKLSLNPRQKAVGLDQGDRRGGVLALSGGINHRVPDGPRVRFMRKWEAPSRLPASASEGCPKEQWRWSR